MLNLHLLQFAAKFCVALVLCGSFFAGAKAQIVPNACAFDSNDPDKLSRCLLRRVKQGANLDAPLAELPSPLKVLVGKPTNISVEKLAQYLGNKNIKQSDVGGTITKKLNKTLYFVIHDTSTPNLENKDFPSRTKPDGTVEQIINTQDWSFNKLDVNKLANITHIFVNRLGESVTKNDFSVQSFQATKYEGARLSKEFCSKKPQTCEPNWKARVAERQGLFVHIELIQPRHCKNPVAGCKDDLIAPEPGFTRQQLKRLALLYMAASVRRGVWLMPAFHAAVDAGRKDGHDDPQNFQMNIWLEELNSILGELN